MTDTYTNQEWLIARIINDGWGINDIAEHCGIDKSTASRHVRSAIQITSIDQLAEIAATVRDLRSVFASTSPAGKRLLIDVERATSSLPKSADLRCRLWHIRENRMTPPTCSSCTMPTSWDREIQSYRPFCSTRCASTAETTNAKRRASNLLARGVEYPAQSKQVRDAYKSTMLERYGVDHVNKHSTSVTALEFLSDDDFLNDARARNMTTFDLGTQLGIPQATVSRMLLNRGIQWSVGRSAFQTQVVDFVQSLMPAGEVVVDTRQVIKPLELDIFIPSKSLAIECDGMYWHSEQFKSRTYHLDKTVDANALGIRLLHVYDVEWSRQRPIVESRIIHALGLATVHYARKCTVRQLTTQEQRHFFNETHIQGYAPASVCYGLVMNGEILAAMSVVKSRYSTRADWELLRYSSALRSSVAGGASKLMSHIASTHQITSMVSYCDLRYGTGDLYRTLGFEHIGNSAPNYHYFSPTSYAKLSRVSFQKHRLKDKLPHFDPTRTEYDNMKAHGYDRVWDCGNSIWLWTAG